MDYIDEDFSGEENNSVGSDSDISVASDSDYIPPQKLRGGADEDNHDEDDDDYDWRADMRSESPSFLAVPELNYNDVTQPIGPLIQ